MNNVIDFINTHRDRYVEELKAYLAIPSISALPQHAADVRKCAEWTQAEMERIGLQNVRLIETPGHPVVYGDWLGAPGKPTILFYGHYDVQPVDPVDLWESPPFEATIRDGEIYARGSADDKGQVFMPTQPPAAGARASGPFAPDDHTSTNPDFAIGLKDAGRSSREQIAAVDERLVSQAAPEHHRIAGRHLEQASQSRQEHSELVALGKRRQRFPHCCFDSQSGAADKQAGGVGLKRRCRMLGRVRLARAHHGAVGGIDLNDDVGEPEQQFLLLIEPLAMALGGGARKQERGLRECPNRQPLSGQRRLVWFFRQGRRHGASRPADPSVVAATRVANASR